MLTSFQELNVVRTSDELWAEAREQFAALQEFGGLYDGGKEWAAKHLASAISTLVRDGSRSFVPLLAQLDILRRSYFLSTARQLQPGAVPNSALVMIGLGPGGTKVAPTKIVLPRPPWLKWLPFAEWWEEIIFIDESAGQLTRKKLIETLRDKDGGSHYDADAPGGAYRRLKTEMHSGFRVNGAPLSGAHFATVRQIAWELEESLRTPLALATA